MESWGHKVVSSDMLWQFQIDEGLPYDLLVRAAQLALCLGDQDDIRVTLRAGRALPAWTALLSPAQRELMTRRSSDDEGAGRALREAREIWAQESSDAQVMQRATASLLATRGRQVRCCVGSAVQRESQPELCLVVLRDCEQVSTDLLDCHDQVFAFESTWSPAVVPAASRLPPAVDELFLTHSRGPAEHVVLIGSGDLDHTCHMVRWLLDAGATRVTLFDPYFAEADYRPSLPAAVEYRGACDAADRAVLYAAAGTVLVSSRQPAQDNAFEDEAMAQSLASLSAFAEPGWDSWSAKHVAQAFECLRTLAPVRRGPKASTSWGQIAARLRTCSDALIPSSTALSASPHQLRHHSCPAVALASAPQAPATLVLVPDEMAQWTAELDGLLIRYERIFVDTSRAPLFFMSLARHFFRTQLQPVLDVPATVARQLAEATARVIDVVHLGGSKPVMARLKLQLAGMAARRSRNLDVSAPRILIKSNKNASLEAGLSSFHVGVSVAADYVNRGLLSQEPELLRLWWLRHHRPENDRQRLYFYPFAWPTGMDQDEVDYGSLPAALRAGQVDALWSHDCDLTGLLAARAFWAQKAVPLFGLMHGLNGARVVSEVIFTILHGGLASFDCLISPSQCGALAYQKLWNACALWLARDTRTPVPVPRVAVVPYGIDRAPFAGLDTQSCRQELGLPRERLILLSVGRFFKQEKADLLPLLLVAERLRREHPELLLVLAGSQAPTGYVEILRRHIAELELQEHVLLVPNLSAQDKALYYGAADLFVALSDNTQETYGLTIVEAMAARLPVVASAWSGYRELVRHGVTGLLIPTTACAPPRQSEQLQRVAEGMAGIGHIDLHESVATDMSGLYCALRTLCADADLRRQLGSAGAEVCRKEYDHLTQGRQMAELLLACVEAARASPWPPPPARTPFYDPVGGRFAHYASRELTDSTVLTVGWQGLSPRLDVLPFARATAEVKLARRILDTVVAAQTISLGELVRKLSEGAGTFSAEQLRMRIARCLKYGILSALPPRS